MDLVPASDPNIPSQTHRIMLNMALMDMAKQAPMLFMPKLPQLAEKVGHGLGINDIDSLLPNPQQWQAILGKLAQPKQQGGGGQAAMAKAQMELPLKAKELQLEDRKLDLAEQTNQREAADQAAQHAQRQQELETEAQARAIELAHEQAANVAEHRREMVALNPDPMIAANLRKSDAQTFAALGSGAAGFAKAGQTIQQAQADVSGITNAVEGASASDVPANIPDTNSGTVAQPKAAKRPRRPKS